MLQIVELMASLAVGLLVSMATVGAIALAICAVSAGGCWMWLRWRKAKSDR
jgi:hypothetical protein